MIECCFVVIIIVLWLMLTGYLFSKSMMEDDWKCTLLTFSTGFIFIFPFVLALSWSDIKHKNDVCIKSHQEFVPSHLAGKVIVSDHYDLVCDQWEPKK